MIIKNARVFTEDGSFMQGDVVVKDGRFDSVLELSLIHISEPTRPY